jgi:hypothetical protein
MLALASPATDAILAVAAIAWPAQQTRARLAQIEQQATTRRIDAKNGRQSM